MAIPFTVDISAFYGEPDFREQDSGMIVDRRKTLNLYKELETSVQPKRAPKRARKPRTTNGGAIGFNGAGCKPDGALAFNEQQLMNELTGFKKGGALGTLAATVIPALIQMAPQIISSIKDLI